MGTFSYPAGSVAGVRRRWSENGKNVPLRIYDREAVRAVRRSETEDIAPESSSERSIICIIRQRNSGTGSVKCAFMTGKTQLKNRARLHGDGSPGIAGHDLCSGVVGKRNDVAVQMAGGPGVALCAIGTDDVKFVTSQCDGIGAGAIGGERDVPDRSDEIAAAHKLRDRVRAEVGHRSEISLELNNSCVAGSAALGSGRHAL